MQAGQQKQRQESHTGTPQQSESLPLLPVSVCLACPWPLLPQLTNSCQHKLAPTPFAVQSEPALHTTKQCVARVSHTVPQCALHHLCTRHVRFMPGGLYTDDPMRTAGLLEQCASARQTGQRHVPQDGGGGSTGTPSNAGSAAGEEKVGGCRGDLRGLGGGWVAPHTRGMFSAASKHTPDPEPIRCHAACTANQVNTVRCHCICCRARARHALPFYGPAWTPWVLHYTGAPQLLTHTHSPCPLLQSPPGP